MDAMTPSRKDMNTSLCVQGIHSDDNHVDHAVNYDYVVDDDNDDDDKDFT